MTQPLGIPSFGAPANPLQSYLRAAQPTDAELRSILRAAAEEAERIIPKELERLNYSGKIKAAQLTLIRREIHQWYAATWGDIGKTLRDGVADVSRAAYTEAESLLMDYMARQGIDTSAYLESLRAQARRGLPNVLARGANGIALSTQVYKTQALARGLVDRAVNNGLLLGHSAQRVADSVRDLIDPNVPGGVSYAAMRLARTELNNAFKTAQEQRHADEPWVKGMQWHLSGSHPRKDECNLFAEQDIHDLGAGIYPVGQRPHSHPNCLCYMTVEQIEEDEWIDRFVAGEYDEYLDEGAGLTEAQIIDLHPKPPNQQAAPAVAKPARKRAPRKRAPKKLVPLDINEEREPDPIDVPAAAEPLSVEKLPPGWPEILERLLRAVLPGNRERIQDELNNQGNYAPNTVGMLAGVRDLNGAELKAFRDRFGKDALGGYVEETMELLITPQVYSAKYQRDWKKSVDNGFYSKPGPGQDAVSNFLAHETGHHVARIARLRGPNSAKPFWNALADGLGIQRPILYDKRSLDKWLVRNKSALEKGVSRYGAEDSEEIIAEVWAEFTTNPNARSHIAAAGKELQVLAEGNATPIAPPLQLKPRPLPNAMTVDEVRLAIENGTFKEERLSGGAVAETALLTDVNTGQRFVRKEDEKNQQVREFLGSVVGRAIGLRVPTVWRQGDRFVYMPYVENTRPAISLLREGTAGIAKVDAFLKSREGGLFAVLDILIHNTDRNEGNWLIDETGNIWGIDHAFSWSDNELLRSMPEAPLHGFADQYTDGFDFFRNLPITAQEAADIREKLTTTKAQFEEQGELRFYEYMLRAYDELVVPNVEEG